MEKIKIKENIKKVKKLAMRLMFANLAITSAAPHLRQCNPQQALVSQTAVVGYTAYELALAQHISGYLAIAGLSTSLLQKRPNDLPPQNKCAAEILSVTQIFIGLSGAAILYIRNLKLKNIDTLPVVWTIFGKMHQSPGRMIQSLLLLAQIVIQYRDKLHVARDAFITIIDKLREDFRTYFIVRIRSDMSLLDQYNQFNEGDQRIFLSKLTEAQRAQFTVEYNARIAEGLGRLELAAQPEEDDLYA